MRIGYWRTLIRKLREKVTLGENAFDYRLGQLVLFLVCAPDDLPIDESQAVRLANDAQGNWLALDIHTAQVSIVDASTGEHEALHLELPVFIAGLYAPESTGMELGPVIEGPTLLTRSKRGVVDLT